MTGHIDLESYPVAAAWLEHCHRLRADIAKLQEEMDRGTAAIKEAMGEAAEARIAGRPVVTWKVSKAAEYIDVSALRAELPDVAARYTRLKTAARPFRIIED